MNEYETQNDSVGSGASWLGWQKVDVAVSAFADAIAHAQSALEGLELAKQFLVWLSNDALELVDDYRRRLADCEDSIEQAIDLVEVLEEDADDLEELLEFITDIEDIIEDEVGDEATDRVKDDIASFIAAKLDPVRESGWNLHNVLIHAA